MKNSKRDRNIKPLYLSPEKHVCGSRNKRIRHGTTDWFRIENGVPQGCILLPCLFNFYAKYIMQNPGLNEAQAGIKIPGKNINNLRYVDDTTVKE